MSEGKLTGDDREFLNRTRDDLRGVGGGFSHPTALAYDLERRGLIEMAGYGSHGGGFVCRWVRTDAGRAALSKGGSVER